MSRTLIFEVQFQIFVTLSNTRKTKLESNGKNKIERKHGILNSVNFLRPFAFGELASSC